MTTTVTKPQLEPPSTPPVIVRETRLNYMDAIRGIAALLVMVEHYCERWFAPVFNPITSYINLGRIGIITFFVISGFVIPMSIERKSDLRAFWISRFCRLYPAYWVALLLMVLFAIAEAQLGAPARMERLSTFGVREWIPNIFIAQMFFRVEDLIPVAWTLGLEWVIYVSASLLHAKGWLNKSWALFYATVLLGIVVGIVVPLLAHHRVPYAAVAALTSAAAGLALYRKWKNEVTLKEVTLILTTYVVILLIGSWINYGLYPSRTESNLTITAFSEITSTILGLGLVLIPMMKPAINYSSVLLWFGRISYSIYILHDVVPIPSFLSGAAGFWFQIAETLVLSYLCYRFIEQPGIKFGKRLVSRLKPHTVANAA